MATSTIKAIKAEYKNVASFYSSSVAALATTDKNAVLALTQGVDGHGYTISNNGDANDGGVIVPKKGWYLVGGRWHFNTLGSGANTLTCAIRKYDGVNTSSIDSYGMTHTGGYHAFSTPLVLYKFNQGDIVFASARNNTAAVGNFGGGLTIQFVCEEA